MVDLLAIWTSRWDPLPECKQLCFNQFFTSENVGCLEHAARGGGPPFCSNQWPAARHLSFKAQVLQVSILGCQVEEEGCDKLGA